MWISPAIFMAALLLLVGLAYEKGGRNEHYAATAMVFASFLTPLLIHQDFQRGELAILAIDCVVLTVLIAIALNSDRYWPLFAAGFQIVNVAVHMAMLMSLAVLPAAYANALAIWSYLVVLAPICGIILELCIWRQDKWKR